MFQSDLRDFCGEESAIAKLSNHFSKDLTLQHSNSNSERITSYNVNELYNNVISQQKENNNITQYCANQNIKSDVVLETTENKSNNFINSINFAPIITIPSISKLDDHNQDIAKVWAHSELSKYDDKVLSEEDFNNLIKTSNNRENIRFTDVIREMASEEQDDLDICDFDEQMKVLRDRIHPDPDYEDIWDKIDSTLKQSEVQELEFDPDNRYLSELQKQLHQEDGGIAEDGHKNDTINKMLAQARQLYSQGYFSRATMILEAILQVDATLVDAWTLLGLSYSENEQDDKALRACEKSLSLQSDNRQVLLSLARIHCNEMNTEQTINYLEKWLLTHVNYRHLSTVGQEALQNNEADLIFDDIYETSMFLSSGRYQILEQQMKMAIEQNNGEIDAELEIAMGTLYHSVQDYDNAALHFEKATLKVRDEPQLWNKLGTAYCNMNAFDKALDAYQRALELAPGFSRAECNLGVAYYNMENYEESIRHALKAYKLQHSTDKNCDDCTPIFPSSNNMKNTADSDPIWTVIRLSSFKLNRPELDLVVFSRDAETLMKEFKVE